MDASGPIGHRYGGLWIQDASHGYAKTWFTVLARGQLEGAAAPSSGLGCESLRTVYQIGCLPHLQQLRLVLVDVRLWNGLASSYRRRVERAANRGQPGSRLSRDDDRIYR